MQAALLEAQSGAPRVVVPNPGVSDELQETKFLNVEAVEQLAAAAATRPKAGGFSGGAAVIGGEARGGAANVKGEKIKKLEPVRPVKGASDALKDPLIIQVGSPAIEEL